MKGIIDRFEGEYAVIEFKCGKLKNIERCRIPKEAQEGDALILEDVIRIDYDETKNRKEKIKKLVKEMWE